MKSFSLGKILVLLIEPDKNVRMMLRGLLGDAGFRNVKEGTCLDDIMCEFQICMPDLIISDIKLADGSFNNFVFKLRHHEIGTNPFLPIIATAFSPTADEIRAVIQAGSDDLIAKPLSGGQLKQRIKWLITSRKPFMVTSAYIGPDRRRSSSDKARDERAPTQTLKVPNVLQAKAIEAHNYKESQHQLQIRASIDAVNLKKLFSHVSQIAVLVDKIVPSLAFGGPDLATKKLLDRLLYVSEDVARRMVRTKFDHVSELCQSLIEVTGRILDAGDFPAPKDVDLLKPLSGAIRRGFDENDTDAAAMAHKISESVHSKN